MLLGKKTLGTIGYMGGLMNVPEPFAWSLAQMIQYNTEYLCEPGEIVHYTRATISYHAAARNNLVDQMLGDWLLMLDTDVTFDPDLCARMIHRMDTNDIDVLAGIYVHKAHPHPPVIYKWDEKGENLQGIGDWDGRGVNGSLIELGSAGAGALLVRRKVYERIRNEMKCGPFDIIHPFGEDNSFFRRLRELGILGYCDPDIQINHMRYQALSLDDYRIEDAMIGDKVEA